ncbi:MAG: pimeloyl-ACP methyl ester carboxylesterase [Paraglaciecola sp.]|jgi:pimeloyl-ACP methyl ester carboxylesterase
MQEVEFTLSNITLGGLAFGDPEKPLMIALHGWLDNAASFIPLSAYLSDYYVVALDFAGHGHSGHRSADCQYHLLDYVHDLHELVEQQQWQDFILLGHSMGGIIASLYSAGFAEKVSQYISIESLGPMTKDVKSSAVQLRESVQSRLANQTSKAQHPLDKQSIIRARAIAGKFNEQWAELLVTRNLYALNGQLRFRTDRRLRILSSLRLTEGQAESFLKAITCPVLVIIAKDGYNMMKESVKQRHNWVKTITVAHCEGSHHPHMDNSAAVAKHVADFLKTT